MYFDAVHCHIVSMTSANGWPQIVLWLILPRLMPMMLDKPTTMHRIHHFHQPALPYNRRPAFVISVCCSTATCLSRFTSTSLLLAATVLCAVSRVVDVHLGLTDVSRTVTFPDRRFPDKTIPGQTFPGQDVFQAPFSRKRFQ